MKKLQLIAVRSQRNEILRELMLLGCVEVTNPEELPEKLLGALKRAPRGEASKWRNDLVTLQNALRQLNVYAPWKKGLLTPLPEVDAEAVLDESALENDLKIAERILSLDVRIRAIAGEESRERAAIEALTPWKGMELPLECTGTKTCSLTLGTVPGTLQLADLQAAAAEVTEEAEITQINADKANRWLTVVCVREKKDELLRAIRLMGFTPLSLFGFNGTPRENIELSANKLESLAREKEELVSLLAAEAENRQALQLGVDTLSTLIAREETGERLMNTESSFYFEGWLTAPDEKLLAERLERFDCAWRTAEPEAEELDKVPVKLRNNRFTGPFNLVTEMYSLPSYKGLDPNPFIAPFFALFFGIMFADMAYGLILLLGGLLFLKKAKPKGGMKQMAGLLIICGITTFIMGFLTGGFFGDAVSVVGGMFGKEWTLVPNFGQITLGDVVISLPLNLLEGNNPLYMLIASVALGFIHLMVGIIIGMYLKIRDGQWADALLNDLSWVVMLAGIGMMVLGKGNTVLFVGIAMLVLGTFLTNKGIARVTGLFGAVYNGATGWLGDLLSYARLMALMLAGSVIASVFNKLGALGGGTVGGVILFIVVFLIGHTLNFGLNVIGCFVHTLRLQYLEFFGKWYRDGGRPFRPLTIKTKYVDITKED